MMNRANSCNSGLETVDAGSVCMARVVAKQLLWETTAAFEKWLKPVTTPRWGSFFLNHPPLRKFQVEVTHQGHVLTKGLPASFEVTDELYLIELQEPSTSQVLLTTQLPKDPSPQGFGFVYDKDTSLLPDGKTRVLGYTREVGKGGVTYIALGHCHSPSSNVQPFVDDSVEASGTTPKSFRGPWETAPFEQLLRNGITWGSGQ